MTSEALRVCVCKSVYIYLYVYLYISVLSVCVELGGVFVPCLTFELRHLVNPPPGGGEGGQLKTGKKNRKKTATKMS